MTKKLAPTEIVRPPFHQRHEALLRQALGEGWVMAYPTETTYAVGGNALDERLVAEISRLKGRPAQKALPLLIDGLDGLRKVAGDFSGGSAGTAVGEKAAATEKLVQTFWPGPLTLVCRAGPSLPAHLTDARGTVAVRWSPHPVIRELLRLGGVPLIGTSANLSGGAPATTLEAVRESFGDSVRVGIQEAEEAPPAPTPEPTTPSVQPSTLLDLTTLPFRVLRPGAITTKEIRDALLEFPRLRP